MSSVLEMRCKVRRISFAFRGRRGLRGDYSFFPGSGSRERAGRAFGMAGDNFLYRSHWTLRGIGPDGVHRVAWLFLFRELLRGSFFFRELLRGSFSVHCASTRFSCLIGSYALGFFFRYSYSITISFLIRSQDGLRRAFRHWKAYCPYG